MVTITTGSWVRMQEIHQSLRIVRQCIAQIEPGPVRLDLPLVVRPKAGREAYGRVEASKGELAFYLVSDGGHCAIPLQNKVAIFDKLDHHRTPAGGVETG